MIEKRKEEENEWKKRDRGNEVRKKQRKRKKEVKKMNEHTYPASVLSLLPRDSCSCWVKMTFI